ncbi:MAG: Crp/Fnr family transcriptional regulator [Halofilum sp. (in: g-proteobacteria)]|nr:Crp/Fnr family transcriptional regulator [Halofilum sp. (in: g-proteobacteria)]
MADVLARQPFFRDLGGEVIDFLAANATERRLKKGEILFEHGQPADRFWLLRSGRVLIEVPAIEGPSLEVQSLGPDEVAGWSWLIPPYKWAFQARADRASEVIEFDGKAVLERCERDPAFGYAVLKRFSALMSERLEAARRTMMEEWNPPGFA